MSGQVAREFRDGLVTYFQNNRSVSRAECKNETYKFLFFVLKDLVNRMFYDFVLKFVFFCWETLENGRFLPFIVDRYGRNGRTLCDFLGYLSFFHDLPSQIAFFLVTVYTIFSFMLRL